MKKTFKLMAALVMGAGMMFSCQQAEEPMMDKAQEPVVKTRAYGDKAPTVTIYVATNDVNPPGITNFPTERLMPTSWNSSHRTSTSGR